MPTNIHIYLGRVIKKEQTEKKIDKYFGEPFYKRYGTKIKNFVRAITEKTKKLFHK